MENIFEGSFEQFDQLIDQAIPDNIGMTDEEYEALLNKQIAEEFAKLDSKNQPNQQPDRKEHTSELQSQR